MSSGRSVNTSGPILFSPTCGSGFNLSAQGYSLLHFNSASIFQVATTVLGHGGWAGQTHKHVSDSPAITSASKIKIAQSPGLAGG